jgi:hypothetical protein
LNCFIIVHSSFIEDLLAAKNKTDEREETSTKTRNQSATAETTVMNGINEDVNTSSTRRVLAVAATTWVTQRRKGHMYPKSIS